VDHCKIQELAAPTQGQASGHPGYMHSAALDQRTLVELGKCAFSKKNLKPLRLPGLDSNSPSSHSSPKQVGNTPNGHSCTARLPKDSAACQCTLREGGEQRFHPVIASLYHVALFALQAPLFLHAILFTHLAWKSTVSTLITLCTWPSSGLRVAESGVRKSLLRNLNIV